MVKPHSPIAECKKPMGVDIISPSKVKKSVAIVNDEIMRKTTSPKKTIKSRSSRRPAVKRVQFFPSVTVKDIVHVDDMSDNLFSSIYLSPEDFGEIKSHVKMTIRLMMS